MTTAVSCAAGNLREQILSAAASCFRERGIKATTMQEIAKRAGISVGNFYNYFDGKDAIIDEFAQREVARLAREIDEIVNGRVSLWDEGTKNGPDRSALLGHNFVYQETKPHGFYSSYFHQRISS